MTSEVMFLLSTVVVIAILYFVIKFAVKNGIEAAYKSITGKEEANDIKVSIKYGIKEAYEGIQKEKESLGL